MSAAVNTVADVAVVLVVVWAASALLMAAGVAWAMWQEHKREQWENDTAEALAVADCRPPLLGLCSNPACALCAEDPLFTESDEATLDGWGVDSR